MAGFNAVNAIFLNFIILMLGIAVSFHLDISRNICKTSSICVSLFIEPDTWGPKEFETFIKIFYSNPSAYVKKTGNLDNTLALPLCAYQ